MKIILLWMCVTTVCLLAIGYITIREILVTLFCATLVVIGGALIWAGSAMVLHPGILLEGFACLAMVIGTLLWASTAPRSLAASAPDAATNIDS